MKKYQAIFISPHLDDAVFSCGGRIQHELKKGPVLVINFFTDYPENIKQMGVSLGKERLSEEKNAATFLGYESKNLMELDAVLRNPHYKKITNLFKNITVEESAYVESLRNKIFLALNELSFETIYVPLAVGWHVDHQILFQVFLPWLGKKNIKFYEDAPYCFVKDLTRLRLNQLGEKNMIQFNVKELQELESAALNSFKKMGLFMARPFYLRYFVSLIGVFVLRKIIRFQNNQKLNLPALRADILELSENELQVKINAIKCYASQFKVFFKSEENYRTDYQSYLKQNQMANLKPFERYWVIK